MKKVFLTSLFTALVSSSVFAAPKATLVVGSAAPPLKVAAIIKGKAVTLDKGVHVIELWATWCGPCRESIPHLSAMAKKFAGRADFTGVSVMEEGDALGRVKAFVKGMGAQMNYNVAYDGPQGAVEKNWLKASGDTGIPKAFVVKNGKIVWMTHPLFLESVVADVVAGTFDPTKQAAREDTELRHINAEDDLVRAVKDASNANNFPAQLLAVKKVIAANPEREAEMVPYQFEALAMTNLPAALAYLQSWSKGPGFDQMPINAYNIWLVVMQRSIKLSKNDWTFLAGLLDRCNARVSPINPLTASAEATSYARSGDLAKAAQWEQKALEIAAARDDADEDWMAAHQKRLAGYQQGAGLEITPPVQIQVKPKTSPTVPKTDAKPAQGSQANEQKAPASKIVGKPAPDFTLQNLEGKPVSLASTKGSVVVLDFWATWCGPCMDSLPSIDALHRELAPRGLKVFAVNEEETVAKIQPTMAQLKLSLPVLRDTDTKMSDKYLVQSIPQTVVIGRDGNVRQVFIGSGHEDEIRAAVLESMNLTEQFALASKLPMVNDDAISDQLSRGLKKLRAADKLVSGDELLQQLRDSALKPLAIPAAKVVPALTSDDPAMGGDLYERARKGVLVIGGSEADSGLFTATGFVLTASGIAVTNYHVIEEAKDSNGLIALTSDGRAVAVRSVLASDRQSDIAIVQLDGDGFTPLEIAEGAPVGAPVAVISHPDRHFYTFTRGVVSRYCLQRYSDEDPYPTPVMEITADYARGSSGGPLLDAQGRVVGMVCSTKSVYLGQNEGRAVGLQMVVKDSIPSELIITLLRGQSLKTLVSNAPQHN